MATSTNIWMAAMVLLVTTRYGQGESYVLHFHKHIVHPWAAQYYIKPNTPPADLYKIHYHVTFSEDKCCPEINFVNCQDECIDDNLADEGYMASCWGPGDEFLLLDQSNLISLNPGYSKSGCYKEDDYYICDSNLTLAPPSPIKPLVKFAYRCKDGPKSLDLTMDIDVEYFTNYDFPCEPVKVDYCKKRFGFNHTAFPNVLGQLSQLNAFKFLTLFTRFAGTAFEECNQHALLFTCLGLFPPCRSDKKRLFPCTQMCRDVVSGCSHVLKKNQQTLKCGIGIFPDSLDPEVCFYKQVMCPWPKQAKSGYTNTTGVLLGNITMCTCNDGYDIEGDTIRHCTIQGTWNSTDPICIQADGLYSNRLLILLLVPVIVLVVVLLCIVYQCVYRRRNNQVINKGGIELTEVQPKKTLFVSYSSVDKINVNENFIPNARNELLGWNLITYEHDFVPGRSITDCIHEGVWDSHAVLILLTANFITSKFCCFEFTEAQTRSVIDNEFRLIVVLFTQDDDKTLAELSADFPEELREYVRTHIYLPLWDPHFWDKLRRALLKQQHYGYIQY